MGISQRFIPTDAAGLVLLVLDGSGSMDDIGKTGKRKTIEVQEATKDVLRRFYGSRVADIFYVEIIAFDTKTRRYFNDFKRVKDIDIDSISDPVSMVGGGNTNITKALKLAYDLAKEFLESDRFKKYENKEVLIVLLSDGMHNEGPPEPEEIAREIRQHPKITLVTIAFGVENDSDIPRLRAIAGEGKFLETADPDKVRSFILGSSTVLAKNLGIKDIDLEDLSAPEAIREQRAYARTFG